MLFSSSLLALSTFAACAQAFPSLAHAGRIAEQAAEFERRSADHARQREFYDHQKRAGILNLGGGLLNGVLQPLSGALQGVDVPTPQAFGVAKIPDANHPYIAPGPTDVRGMCPTMNTLANHGYIARNGITTFAEAANACQIAFGFAYDLCVFLSSVGLAAGGDLATGKMSIGGADSRVPNTLGPALGLSHHGPFECDMSMTRQDTYFGNQANFQLDRWNQLVSFTKPNGGLFNEATMVADHKWAYNQSRSTNPEFDFTPVPLFVTFAERIFTYRALTNGTAGGKPDYANVAPFFLNETFPKNWYRRGTPYTLAQNTADIAAMYAQTREEVGINEGLGHFVPSTSNIGDDLSPSRLACLLETISLTAAPGEFDPQVVQNFDLVESFVNAVVKPFFSSYNCPTTDYTKPGPNAGNPDPGPNASGNVIVNGVYQ